jgi:hypothetical protein
MTDRNRDAQQGDSKTSQPTGTPVPGTSTPQDSPIDQGQGGQTQAANDPRNQPVESGGEATGNGPKGPGGSESKVGTGTEAGEKPAEEVKQADPNPSDDLSR